MLRVTIIMIWLALSWLILRPAAAPAADPPKAPAMAEGEATITELNFFTNFNTSAYSISIGKLDIRADKQGPPCEGTSSGQTLAARYDNKIIVLGSGKTACTLTVRRMEFTDAPGAR